MIRLTILICLLTTKVLPAKEGVILLHGLCRSSASMSKMASALENAGYVVENVSYPSRTNQIKVLAESAIDPVLKRERFKNCSKIHFVTHSLGGILVRSYFHQRTDKRLGRVVMLSPPNQGSEVIDRIGAWKLTRWINGPAGNELGTKANSTPNKLGRINFECGVIAGDRSFNWINSLLIPGKDDGKVSLKRSKIAGINDHRTLHVTHPYIMKNKKVITETMHFLKTGTFKPVE